MKQFETKQFNIPELQGISSTTIAEHLKLYAGYVKNANLIISALETPSAPASDIATYTNAELQRRFSFEYNGIRNHEVYFNSLVGGKQPLQQESALYTALVAEFGSYEACIERITALALTRGIGWAMLVYDSQDDRLLLNWVDEQHLGQLQDCSVILALDMWEHSYVADYLPSGKKKYVTDYLANINWGVLESSFLHCKHLVQVK